MNLFRTNPRTLVAVAYDLFWSLACWLGIYGFRLSFEQNGQTGSLMFSALPVVLGVQMSSFYAMGLYRGIWRYASLHDIARVAGAVGISAHQDA